MPQRIILGAMSGTSADGVDVAVTAIAGKGLKMRAELLHLTSRRFAPALRQRITRIRSAQSCELRDLALLGRELTFAYASACKVALQRTGISPDDIAAIAAHGQTLFHAPPLTIQYFDPSLLAYTLGIPVISDFRRADCAAGGQGAPLVPFADYLLFRHPKRNRVLLNIGGIANITYLPAGGSLEKVIAFDTGPGNCLSDAIAQQEFGIPFDEGGRRALAGTPDLTMVEPYLRQPYFRRRPPKSTDGPAMLQGLNFPASIRGEDRLATACLCCARAVARGIAQLPGPADELFVAGGGSRNALIMQMLAEETQLPVRHISALDIFPMAREAMAFALLGAATLDLYPSNVPSVTGASRPVILGSLTPVP